MLGAKGSILGALLYLHVPGGAVLIWEIFQQTSIPVIVLLAHLGGGFKYILFSPLSGKMIQFDWYFSNGLGCNHHLVTIYCIYSLWSCLQTMCWNQHSEGSSEQTTSPELDRGEFDPSWVWSGPRCFLGFCMQRMLNKVILILAGVCK